MCIMCRSFILSTFLQQCMLGYWHYFYLFLLYVLELSANFFVKAMNTLLTNSLLKKIDELNAGSFSKGIKDH